MRWPRIELGSVPWQGTILPLYYHRILLLRIYGLFLNVLLVIFLKRSLILESMNARIANYRQGKHTQTNNQMVLRVPGVSTKDAAAKLVGKVVVWKSPAGKELSGKITASHGNSGCVRVLFSTGMPGQSVGSLVEVK